MDKEIKAWIFGILFLTSIFLLSYLYFSEDFRMVIFEKSNSLWEKLDTLRKE